MAGGDTHGYYQHVCICVACNHGANVDPQRLEKGGRPICTQCGSRDYTVRLIWTPGDPPDNVIPISGAPAR